MMELSWEYHGDRYMFLNNMQIFTLESGMSKLALLPDPGFTWIYSSGYYMVISAKFREYELKKYL